MKKQSKILTTVFLLVLISVGYFATDIYLPSLPRLSDYFMASEREVQMTLFSYLISFSFTPILFGPISDHVGRKKVVLFGLLTAIASTVGCLFAASIYWMIGLRFLQGIGTGATMIAARSMIADLFTGKEFAKQINYITMFMPLVLAIAPTIGGYLQENFGWQSVFLFLLCYLIFVTAWAAVSKESLTKYSEEPISRVFVHYKEVLRNRAFVLFGFGMVIPTIGLFAYLTASPFLFQEIIGLSPFEFGNLALYIGAVIMISSYSNSKLLHYFPINQLIAIGVFCMVAAGSLMLFLHLLGILTTWSILGPILLFFCCLPLTVGNSISKAISKLKGKFGVANGLMTTTQFLAGALGSLIFSLIPEHNALPLSICILSVGLLSCVNLFFACRYEKRMEQK